MVRNFSLSYSSPFQILWFGRHLPSTRKYAHMQYMHSTHVCNFHKIETTNHERRTSFRSERFHPGPTSLTNYADKSEVLNLKQDRWNEIF